MNITTQVVNGTTYGLKTPREVIDVLEKARVDHTRIRVFYGSKGVCFNDAHDIIGTIGRSSGIHKVPILMHNCTSISGSSLLDDLVVRIDARVNGKIVTLYKDPETVFTTFVHNEGSLLVCFGKGKVAMFDTAKKAQGYADFMNGKKWRK